MGFNFNVRLNDQRMEIRRLINQQHPNQNKFISVIFKAPHYIEISCGPVIMILLLSMAPIPGKSTMIDSSNRHYLKLNLCGGWAQATWIFQQRRMGIPF
jgi:hypothetical protein